MGRAASIRFVQEGAAVVVADLNSNGGEETVAECKKTGGRAVFQRVDVMNEADIKGAVDRAVTEFGKLDVIFNNAGVGGALGRSRRPRWRTGTEPRRYCCAPSFWG